MSPSDQRGVESDKLEAGHSGVHVKRYGAMVIIILIGVGLALLLPAIQGAREASRRMACQANLKRIGLAINDYCHARRCFPPGNICVEPPWSPATPIRQPGGTMGWNVLGEAASTTATSSTTLGMQGTSFLLRVLPFIEGSMEGNVISTKWNWTASISNQQTTIAPYAPNCNFNLAITDIKGFYCPSRRNSLRAGDDTLAMFAWSPLSTMWTGGGTDYGGCAGRHYAFGRNNYNYVDPTVTSGSTTQINANIFVPALVQGTVGVQIVATATNQRGIFGVTNQSVTSGQIRDGTSNTFMTGELQRVSTVTPHSVDGWVVGGPCTLFTVGAMFISNSTTLASTTSGGLLMNNNFYGSPGSDHLGGANFGMADGSVRFIPDTTDPNVFARLGSMADSGFAEPSEK